MLPGTFGVVFGMQTLVVTPSLGAKSRTRVAVLGISDVDGFNLDMVVSVAAARF